MTDLNPEMVEKVARRIEEHAYRHRISNSPYGHVCPSECLGRAVLGLVNELYMDEFTKTADINRELFGEVKRLKKELREARDRCERWH